MSGEVRKAWKAFAAAALKEVPEGSVQYVEMRKAFFAGAVSLISLLENAPDGAEEAFALSLKAEVSEFFWLMAAARKLPRGRSR